MGKSITQYVIVQGTSDGNYVAKLLDEGFTLVISWVAGEKVHHILSKNAEEDGSQDD